MVNRSANVAIAVSVGSSFGSAEVGLGEDIEHALDQSSGRAGKFGVIRKLKFLDDGTPKWLLIVGFGSDFPSGAVEGSVCEQRLLLDELRLLRSNKDLGLSSVGRGADNEKNHTGHPPQQG